jgi:hypothetical protein
VALADRVARSNSDLGSALRRGRRFAYRAVGRNPGSTGRIAAERLDDEILAGVSPVVVASHRRSGTHLAIDLLRRQFPSCNGWKLPGEGLDSLYVNLDKLGLHREPLTRRRLATILARSERPIFKTHTTPDFGELRDVQGGWVDDMLQHSKLIYMVRDGRPVMVSAMRHEERLGTDTGERVLDYMRLERDGKSRVREWADHVEQWMSMEGVLVVRYEDIVGRGRETVARIGDFLGLSPRWLDPLVPPLVRGRWQKRAMRFTHVRPPTTALTPPTAPRPWRELLGPEELSFFESEAGGLLRKLGYVESPGATADRPPELSISL